MLKKHLFWATVAVVGLVMYFITGHAMVAGHKAAEIVEEYEVDTFVIGNPINMNWMSCCALYQPVYQKMTLLIGWRKWIIFLIYLKPKATQALIVITMLLTNTLVHIFHYN